MATDWTTEKKREVGTEGVLADDLVALADDITALAGDLSEKTTWTLETKTS